MSRHFNVALTIGWRRLATGSNQATAMAAPASRNATLATSRPSQAAGGDRQAALAALEKLAKAAQTVATDETALRASAPPKAAGIRAGRVEAVAALFAVGVAATLGFTFGPHVLSGEEPQLSAAAYDDVAPWKPVVTAATAPQAKVDQLQREVDGLRGALRRQSQDFQKEFQALRRDMAEAATHAPRLAAQSQKDGVAALEKQVARIDRLERLMADQTPTDAPKTAARPEGGVTKAMRATPVPPGGYVLRRVVDGVAHVQSERGLEHVIVGDVLPGAGRVRAIEKRDGRWLVFTKNGVIDQNDY